VATAFRIRRLSVVNLILEPSTRTRCAFEIAEERLGVEHVSLRWGEALSLAKGETLLDTARTLASMGVNVLVIRHPEAGIPGQIASMMPDLHVVNAGDGNGEHPTQGLIDLLTLRRRWGSLKGSRVLIVGDIAHSRVARSNYYGLSALAAEVVLCGPASLLPHADQVPLATLSSDLDSELSRCDAVMALRIQHERLAATETVPDLDTYRELYGLTSDRMMRVRADVPVLHPGPLNRGVEIDGAVADGERSLIWQQVRAGVAVRMAVLEAMAQAPLRSPAAATLIGR
jgi:aspartate carbamoyltransferase catalytic subunit